MRISIAEHAGFCFGVERALRLAQKAIGEGREVLSLGPLIHNRQVVERLKRRGLRVVESLEGVHGATLIIRTHGALPVLLDEARARGFDVIDATCPFVKRAQSAAAAMLDEGYAVVVVGDRQHPEAAAIVAHTGGEAVIVEDADEVERLDLPRKVGVVAQTTQRVENVASVVAALLPRCEELRIANTICDATASRQEAAARLADEVDLMIVIGGFHSANTRRLAEICASRGTPTRHIECADDIDPAWLTAVEHVGLTAGASTPDSALAEVRARIQELST